MFGYNTISKAKIIVVSLSLLLLTAMVVLTIFLVFDHDFEFDNMEEYHKSIEGYFRRNSDINEQRSLSFNYNEAEYYKSIISLESVKRGTDYIKVLSLFGFGFVIADILIRVFQVFIICINNIKSRDSRSASIGLNIFSFLLFGAYVAFYIVSFIKSKNIKKTVENSSIKDYYKNYYSDLHDGVKKYRNYLFIIVILFCVNFVLMVTSLILSSCCTEDPDSPEFYEYIKTEIKKRKNINNEDNKDNEKKEIELSENNKEDNIDKQNVHQSVEIKDSEDIN